MKLYFENLGKLHLHIDYLESTIGLKDFFVVGGVVRDLIIGKEKEIVDVDLTMAGDPNYIWESIKTSNPKSQSNDLGLFRTEKFGTMTIITSANTEQEVKYEITPFREESGYSDFRHPEHIKRSESLVLDAARRDFTINGIYYSRLKAQSLMLKAKSGVEEVDLEGDSNLLKNLKENGRAIESNILILQHHEIINNFLPKGKFSDSDYQSFCKANDIDGGKIIGIVRDPFLGIQDIVDGKIRAIGNADNRFNEDALRILRAIRFQNTLNFDSLLDAEFDYEQATWKSMKKNYFLVKQLSKERIHEEVKKVFSGPNPFGYVAVLDELNILKYLFPGIYAIKYLTQPVRYHPFDVYSHTMLALSHLQSINTYYLVRIAMLYHDSGKIEQYHTHSLNLEKEERSFIYGGRLNHVNCGQDIAKEDLERIGFSNKEIAEVQWYIGYHMKPGEVLMSKQESRVKKMRELYASGGYEQTRNLLDICKGDRRGHFNPIQKPAIDKVDKLYDILDNLKNSEGQFTMSKMAIDGNDIMTQFDLKPGKKIGELMKIAYEWVLEEVQERNDRGLLLEFIKKFV